MCGFSFWNFLFYNTVIRSEILRICYKFKYNSLFLIFSSLNYVILMAWSKKICDFCWNKFQVKYRILFIVSYSLSLFLTSESIHSGTGRTDIFFHSFRYFFLSLFLIWIINNKWFISSIKDNCTENSKNKIGNYFK